MGVKLAVAKWKKERRISVSWDTLQYKKKTRTFKMPDMTTALDFALSLDNRYIEGCCDELHDFAVKIDHDILTKKNWCFA